jgi:ornithine carbamoyltransferase
MPDEEFFSNNDAEGRYLYSDNPQEAAVDADVIYICPYADVSEYTEELKPYQVNKQLLSLAKEDVLVMHPLPAHRGWEIDSDTFESYADEIFTEAENRLHIQKSVLVLCMKGN